ncbi:hypothetical protein MLD38_013592 [Melastoma candidum]|uniref:Uncharacterized protein n=1 Tax=Melastoma candidum TaxID=119954 RepID=A0ACB9RA26_9MYRT|nr:hypothetical protein MLD38_013592 [Melastoma candidum]
MGDKKKAATVFVRLVSAAGTGFFYVKKKNPRKMLEKLEFRKYDPRVNRHVLFTEAKMKIESGCSDQLLLVSRIAAPVSMDSFYLVQC